MNDATEHRQQPARATLKPDPAEEARRRGAADDVARLAAALAGRGIVADPDVARLAAALAGRGIVADPDVVFDAWERHSETHAAGWLALYEDDADNCAALLAHPDLSDEPADG